MLLGLSSILTYGFIFARFAQRCSSSLFNLPTMVRPQLSSPYVESEPIPNPESVERKRTQLISFNLNPASAVFGDVPAADRAGLR